MLIKCSVIDYDSHEDGFTRIKSEVMVGDKKFKLWGSGGNFSQAGMDLDFRIHDLLEKMFIKKKPLCTFCERRL